METSYRTPFHSWKEDPPDLHVPFEEHLNFFSPDLTPLLGSAEVREKLPESAQRDLMIHQLYAYLSFTDQLEKGPVNQIAALLSRPSFLPDLDPQRREDANHVYRDEGKHADWSFQLMADVEAETGVQRLEVEPGFLVELQRLIDEEADALADFVKLFFVIVSETLITGSLNRLPQDETVQAAVRNVARAHAHDEGRHHKYFKSLFIAIWPTMPRQLRVRIGTMLPAMLRAFLMPDRGYLVGVLRLYSVPALEPDRVVEELLSSDATTASIRAAAGPSIKMFEEAQIFAEPAIAEAFIRNHLWSVDGDEIR